MSVQRRPKKGTDKQGKVRWIVRWYDLTGAEHSKTFHTEKDAKKFNAQVRIDRDKGKFGSQYGSAVTFADFSMQEWIPSQHVKESSQNSYLQAIREMSLHGLGDVALSKITRQDVQGYYNLLTSGRPWRSGSALSPRTAQRHMSVITAVFSYAEELGYIDVNPASKVHKMPEGTKAVDLDDIPSVQDVHRIVDLIVNGGISYRHSFQKNSKTYSLTTSPNPWLTVPIILSVSTGLRLSECLGLLVSEVDLDNRVIKVRQQKAKSGSDRVPLKTPYARRTVPYPETLHPFLSSICINRPAGRFLCSPDGERPFSSQHVTKSFKRACDHLGLSFTFHSLRHLYASMMIAEGCPVPVLSKLLGHSSSVVTMSVYVHALDDSATVARQHANAVSTRF